MIKIKYLIHLDEGRMTKIFYFDQRHEKNFEILYKIAEDKIANRREGRLEEFLIVLGYRIVKEIRNKTWIEQKLHKTFENKIKSQVLKKIREISFEALVDDVPKKILSIPIS